jgi:SAM-dependent methyltransferase
MIMKISEKTDPLEQAFADYLDGKTDAEIVIHSNKGETENVAVSYFFRDYDQMPLLEQKALAMCEGDILDIGAGSGIHSLFLQQNGKSVTALEIKKGLIETMKKRGINNRILSDIYKYDLKKYDTLLMLMNGIGFTADFNGLERFLLHAKRLLNPGGQIILDSSDLLYLYEEEDGSYLINLNEGYYGEVEYQFEYNENKGELFKWLFVDFSNLSFIAEELGFDCELVFEDEHFNYLAKLTLIS